MKYYDQLSNLETELIRLETLTSLVSVITSGFENSANYKDLQNSLYHIEDALKSANENIRREFQELWDVIRDDTQDYDDPFDESFEEEFDNSEEDQEQFNFDPQYNFEPVENVVKSWAKS